MKTLTVLIHSTLIAGLAMTSIPFANADDDTHKDYYKSDQPLNALDVDAIEGKDVVDRTGHQLGDVDEVVHSKTGEKMAVIGLEDSTKEVAIPLDRLEMAADGGSLITMLNRADLEALPDYDPLDLQSAEE